MMLKYYLRLALVGIRRNPGITTLITLAIALGVALTMAAYTVLYVMSRDPIPEKSAQLFAVQIDNGGPKSRAAGDNEPPQQLSYRDANALLAGHKAVRQAAMHQVSLTLKPADSQLKPYAVSGRATSGDFFPMFNVPMLYGRGWTASMEMNLEPVVVLSKHLNSRLFAGANSVGRSVLLNEYSYQVVGVMDDWDPKPRFYDVIGGQSFDEGDDVYLPLPLTFARQMSTSEYEICNAGPRGQTFDDLTRSECVWLQYWVELDSPAALRDFKSYLSNYAKEQRLLGRFDWPPNIRIRAVKEWLVAQKVVPNDAKLSLLVACSFFVVCIVSAMGLMLARTFAQAGELGIRRALGASSRDCFAQALVEAGVLGFLGGSLGLILTHLGLWTIRALFPEGMSRIATINPGLSTAAVLLAVCAALVAGLYPAWRSTRVPPALQMREA